MPKSSKQLDAEIATELARTAPRKLRLGHETTVPDGTYFVVGGWSYPARAYVDRQDLGLYPSEGLARDAAARALMVGMTRLIRYTVWQGSVTTRKQLG